MQKVECIIPSNTTVLLYSNCY